MQQPGQSLSREEAARAMSRLLKQEADIDVSPEEIIKLFGDRWSTLSRLAHSIHRSPRGN